ncbi:MAG: translational GTPase TypA [Alphaproteobacteria bacterium]|nr:translational GTPase TypA [Alphaproteobacteria bacterium]
MTHLIRNIAIIAHVDHGKTTFVDAFLKQSGAFRDNQHVDTCALDSGDLERERGITIFAKCTSVEWRGIRINIVDTPGHADFGGEVERILGMVDGVVLLVDAAEGPLPQTKFVLGKALKLGLRPIVVINKIDRADARPVEVHNAVFDLFAHLGATDDQLDFPTLFASGREGWAVDDLKDARTDIAPLFRKIVDHVPPPAQCDENGPFKMLVTTLEADPFVGRILTGRILSGKVKTNQTIKAIRHDGSGTEQARASKILAFRGLKRQPIDAGVAGDIVSIAGFEDATVADTLCDLSVAEGIASQPIDPPTLTMTFGVNTSPLAGREGDKVTSRMIWARLEKEAEGNIALKIAQTASTDSFEVSGRGELQLGILIETMRREGFELSVSRPRVVTREDADGRTLEPFEEITIDVDDAYTGVVVEKMSLRRGEMLGMSPSGGGKTRLVFLAPARGLIGYHGEFLTDTCGTGVLNRLFHGYMPHKGAVAGRRNGVLVSMETGASVAYALWKIQERGPLFIGPGVPVYAGMIIGANAKQGDIEVNPIKGKQLTNMRAAGKDEAVALVPPMQLSLEAALAYIEDDELVEITPKSIRLRKRLLDSNDRRKEERKKEA